MLNKIVLIFIFFGLLCGASKARSDSYSLELLSLPFFQRGENAYFAFVYVGVTPKAIYVSDQIIGKIGGSGKRSVMIPAGGGRKCVDYDDGSTGKINFCVTVTVIGSNSMQFVWERTALTVRGPVRYAGTYTSYKNGDSCQNEASDLRRTFYDQQDQWTLPYRNGGSSCSIK